MKLKSNIKLFIVVMLLMTMTVLHGQSYVLENLIGDIVWYKAKSGIRYDLPKVVLQNLELKARQGILYHSLLNETLNLNDQIILANLKLQEGFLDIQIKFKEIKEENESLKNNVNELFKQNKLLKKDNKTIARKLKFSKIFNNIALGSVTVILVLMLISK